MVVASVLREDAIYFKSCPRCRGDIGIKYDVNGWYLDCFQCGYTKDIDVTPRLSPANPDGPQYKGKLNELTKVA